MRRILMLGLLALALGACGRAAEKPAATAHEPPIGPEAPATSDTTRETPEVARDAALAEIESERARLSRSLESGSLDDASMPAYRLRDLSRAFAANASGIAASESRALEQAAARIGTATVGIETAATRGDLGAARERFAEVQAALAAFTGVASGARVQGLEAALESRSVKLRGEIIDPQCFFTHDGRGADHASCALFCARGGQDLAFLDDSDGRVYPLIAATHGMDPNHGLYPHVGKSVQMEGVLFRRGATAFLLIQRVDGREVVAKEAS